MNIYDYIENQKRFSQSTFGPGSRTQGLIKHIRKELEEIEADPTDIMEWIDVMILALDGAWRAGYSTNDIIDAAIKKQQININRKWPDWNTLTQDQPIEHLE